MIDPIVYIVAFVQPPAVLYTLISSGGFKGAWERTPRNWLRTVFL